MHQHAAFMAKRAPLTAPELIDRSTVSGHNCGESPTEHSARTPKGVRFMDAERFRRDQELMVHYGQTELSLPVAAPHIHCAV